MRDKNEFKQTKTNIEFLKKEIYLIAVQKQPKEKENSRENRLLIRKSPERIKLVPVNSEVIGYENKKNKNDGQSC